MRCVVGTVKHVCFSVEKKTSNERKQVNKTPNDTKHSAWQLNITKKTSNEVGLRRNG